MKKHSLHGRYVSTKKHDYIAAIADDQAATYEINCKELRFLNDRTVAGYRSRELKSIDAIYDLINPKELHFVEKYTHAAIQFCNREKLSLNLQTQNKIIFRMKGRKGKIYTYLRHSIVNGVKNGQMVSNFTYLHDITWMNCPSLSWQLLGPGTDSFDFSFTVERKNTETLSEREVEILRLLAKGFHSADIGKSLNISRHTVDTHRRNMLRKLDAANTPELLSHAFDMKII